ncbi:MAG: NADH-quinone oxidoreductase subunit L [Bacteroidia bacterium]
MDILLVALIPVLPILSFLINGIFGKVLPVKFAGIFGTTLICISAILSGLVAYNYFLPNGQMLAAYEPDYLLQFTWMEFSDSLVVKMGAVLDPISVMMLIVVTLISSMVHLYSIAYMKGEERYATYYAFLGLFTFSMLMLVLSINMIQLYIFWELVGVSSFLLISFYFDRPSAVSAAKKAFIVTRFADMFFLIGILMVSYFGESLDIATLVSRLTDPESSLFISATATGFMGLSALAWGLMLIFIGGAGKSAMFPLHVWLPDAMEGPTPVSALIHAATMVVAGVYLVARLFPVFAIAAPDVLQIIAYIGVFTAMFAAIIACTQFDIKRVLAYSTMSQIGYMLFALGVAGYTFETGTGFTASMFHLFTHAIFKALLFLGAGAVIHYVHSNDMRDMGGLRKHMPITHITFLIACLAIAGIPPFAGFFSKEMILGAAFESNLTLFYLGLFTSGLTAFYMFRLYFSIFWRGTSEAKHSHQTWQMSFPLMLLAVGTLVAGFVPFQKLVTFNGEAIEVHAHTSLIIAAVSASVLGIALATLLYRSKSAVPLKIVNRYIGLHEVIYRKFYIDEIYLFITRKVVFNLISRPIAWFDRNIIDYSINQSGVATEAVSEGIKKMQSGSIQSYTVYFMAGLILFALSIILFS